MRLGCGSPSGASRREHFERWADELAGSACFGGAPYLIGFRLSHPKRVAKRLHCDVTPDEPAKPKAIDDGARGVGDPRVNALEPNRLDAVLERRAGKANDAGRELLEPRGAGLVWDGDPDLAGELRSEIVDTER